MVNIKGEDFFKYSAASMQAQVLKTKYWLEGYAICNFEDRYYWQAMPLSDLFYYNDNTIRTAGMQPVCDIGTLETISFFIVLTPQLNALGLQPVSCIFKTGTNIEIKERLYTHDELIEEASYINYAFYDVAHTNCKVRLPKYDLELDALYTLAQQLGLSVEFMPLHKLFLNSYIHNKVIVLPTNNCILHLPLLLKHIAEYILFTTTTQMAEITSFEFFLVQVMLNAVITERIPIYSVPDEDLISVEQQLISLTRVSKLVVYLFTQLNINIKETDSMQLSYIIERKPIQSKKNNSIRFKGRK